MFRLRAVLCACLWIVWGCECGDEQLGSVVPVLEVDAQSLDFGQVPLGATKRLTVQVSNQGQAALELLSVDAATPFGVVLPSGSIAPGASVALEVWFRPTNDEVQAGLLNLASNDPLRPMLEVALTGVGVQGFLSVNPTTVELQHTKVGTVRTVELVLDNRGLAEVQGTLRGVGFEQPENFVLSLLPDLGGSGPFVVSSRTQLVLDLTYRPLDVGEHNGRLVFEICGEACGLEVEVLASAAAPLVRLEPPLLDFGDVGIGQARTLQLRVENGGDEVALVTRVSISGSPDLTVQVARGLPAELQPGDAVGINVEFTASSAAEVMGEVQVETGPVPETVRAALVGRGVGPLFRVEPETLSFGVERVPDTYRRQALLVNAGSSDVRVQGISMTGDPAYSLGALPGLPARLSSGESMTVPVLFSPQAVAEYFGTLVVESDDADNARVEVSVSGALTDRYCELELSSAHVSFGLLPPGFVRQRAITVSNVGTDPCNIIGADFRLPLTPSISEVTQPWPATLLPGEQLPLIFEYAPMVRTESKAVYVMHTDDVVFPDRTVSVFGTSEGNLEIFARPDVVDFGAMGVGCARKTQPVLLFNAGTVDAVVSTFTLTSSSTEIVATRPLPAPVNIPAGGVLTFEVGYAAQDLGLDLGDIELGIPSFGFSITVPLFGSGSVNPRITDVFHQSRNDKVDVLFVIDDSCSMAEEQVALAQNFQAFIQQADVRQVDFHLGVTTTDIFQNPGALRGPVLDRSTPSVEAAFQLQAAVGIFGAGWEQGLEAMLLTFQEGARANSEQAKLLRPDAYRVVIVVSDEDDQSPLPVAAYYNELLGHSPSGFITATVTGQASGCSNPATGFASNAPRYEDFTRLTGGLSESICSGWAQTLASIGQAAFGLRSKFLLSNPAVQTMPIQVWVDGQLRTTGWHYDAADDSIVFDTPPPEGSEVTVEFTPAC